jgi:hypothetical protein
MIMAKNFTDFKGLSGQIFTYFANFDSLRFKQYSFHLKQVELFVADHWLLILEALLQHLFQFSF